MIRYTKIEDLPVLVDMAEKLFELGNYDEYLRFDKASAFRTFMQMHEEGTVFTDGKSCVVGFLITPLYYNYDIKIAQELVFYKDPSFGSTRDIIKMLRMAINRAKELGATMFSISSIESLNGDKMSRIYQKMGFKVHEKSHFKEL